MNAKKILAVLILPILVISLSFFGVKVYRNYEIKKIEQTVYPIKKDFNSVEKNIRSGCLAYNYKDKAKHIGFMDYVFIGRVEKTVGTTYTNVYYENGEPNGIPWTNYEVTVLGNIKGNLKQNIKIPIRKWAGLSYNNKYITINDGDCMPEEGYCYIFCTFVDENGELYISCNDSNIILGRDCEDIISQALQGKGKDDQITETIKAYIEAEAKKDTSVDNGTPRNKIRADYLG